MDNEANEFVSASLSSSLPIMASRSYPASMSGSSHERLIQRPKSPGHFLTLPSQQTKTMKPEKPGLAGQSTTPSQLSSTSRDLQSRDDGTPYPTGLKLGFIVLGLCLSIFLMALDNAIIAPAIPIITDTFHSLPDVGWYGSAYLLTTSALQLVFGKFYTFLSTKRVFVTAICLFELGSLVCGVAPNSATLIAGRALAGVGSAGLLSGSMLILAHSVPLAQRPVYSGLIGGMYGVASVAGPLLGGVFTDKATWRWCFWINLPLGTITVAVVACCFSDPQRPLSPRQHWGERLMHFDPIGTVLFMAAVVCLLLALQWGGVTYEWSSGRIIALLAVSALAMVGFLVVQQRQQDQATVPPRLLAHRTVWAGGLYAFCTGASFFLPCLYLPLWFQAVEGTTAVESGLRNLPMLLTVVVLTAAAGAAVTAWGHYAPCMLLGTACMATGAGLLATLAPGAPAAAWAGYQVLFGAGVGLGIQQPLMAAQTVLGGADVAAGTALMAGLQSLGGAVAVGAANAVFTNGLARALAAAGLPAAVARLGATRLQTTLPPALRPAVAAAYRDALAPTFLIAAALAALGLVGSAAMPWHSVKDQEKKKPAAAAV